MWLHITAKGYHVLQVLRRERMTNRDWIEHWRRVGPKLEQVRRAELRALDYEAQLPAIEALLEIACKLAQPRTTSGLAELHKRLARRAK
jgi:hypothetical protein